MTTAETHEAVDRVSREDLLAAIEAGAREAVLLNKKLGNPIAVWRDGKVVIVPPEEIVMDPLEEKLRKIATKIYGADDIILDKKARQQLKRLKGTPYEFLPVCIAKTQYSFTDDPAQVHTYAGFTITVDDLLVNAGAGFIVAVCGEIMRMPGLPEKPNALHIDVQNGQITGLR